MGTYLLVGNNHGKLWLIPHNIVRIKMASTCKLSPEEWPMSHQLVGRVMAYQGDDG